MRKNLKPTYIQLISIVTTETVVDETDRFAVVRLRYLIGEGLKEYKWVLGFSAWVS